MVNKKFMLEAVKLARKGKGWVSPNPPVGCVIVADGKIVGRGWHEKYGGDHAEVNALREAGVRARGADAYVTLMPCNHFGKTPPCTRALIAAGINRVFVAVDDPDEISGDGKEYLRNSGVEVQVGCAAKEAEKEMAGFLKFIKEGIPHITLKYAMTFDGKIATSTGSSKWISAEESRQLVQEFRAQSDAVMVGSGTMLADDPRLNVRTSNAPQPFRVIVDSGLQTPFDAQVFHTPGSKVILLTSENVGRDRILQFEKAGAEIITVAEADSGYIDLRDGLKLLGENFGVRDILCEGGGKLAGVLFRLGLVDRVIGFIAPKILGGSGISPTEGGSVISMAEALKLNDFECHMLGSDIVCSGRVEK